MIKYMLVLSELLEFSLRLNMILKNTIAPISYYQLSFQPKYYTRNSQRNERNFSGANQLANISSMFTIKTQD